MIFDGLCLLGKRRTPSGLNGVQMGRYTLEYALNDGQIGVLSVPLGGVRAFRTGPISCLCLIGFPVVSGCPEAFQQSGYQRLESPLGASFDFTQEVK